MHRTLVSVAVSTISAFAFLSTPVFAGANSPGSVTACSKNGHFTCYTAAVEPGQYGARLRLKHGTKIDCGSDCRETLRRATVDFWDDRRENY